MGLSESGEGEKELSVESSFSPSPDPSFSSSKTFVRVDAGYGGAEAILIGVCLPVLQQEEQKRVAMI